MLIIKVRCLWWSIIVVFYCANAFIVIRRYDKLVFCPTITPCICTHDI